MDSSKPLLDFAFFKGLLASFGVKGLSLLINLAAMPVYVDLLGSDGAGEFLTYSSTLLLVAALDPSGFGLNIRKFIAGQLADQNEISLVFWLRMHWRQMALRLLCLGMLGAGICCFSGTNLSFASPLFFAVLCVSGLLLSIIQVEIARENLFVFATINGGHMIGFQSLLLLGYLAPKTPAQLWSSFLFWEGGYWLVITGVLFFRFRPNGVKTTSEFKHWDGWLFGLQQLLFLGTVGFVELIFMNVYSSETVLDYQYYSRLFNIFIIFVTGISNPLWARLERRFLSSSISPTRVRGFLIFCWVLISGAILLGLFALGSVIFPLVYGLAEYNHEKMLFCAFYVIGYSAFVFASVLATVAENFKVMAIALMFCVFIRAIVYTTLGDILDWHVTLGIVGFVLFSAATYISLKVKNYAAI